MICYEQVALLDYSFACVYYVECVSMWDSGIKFGGTPVGCEGVELTRNFAKIKNKMKL